MAPQGVRGRAIAQKQQHPPREEVRWVSFCKDQPGGGVLAFDRGNFGRRIKPGDILVFD
jgi:hypothetical protein